MTDRDKTISSFESSILLGYSLPNTLLDQFIVNSTAEFAPMIDGAGGRILIEYTPSTFTGETIDVPGVFNRELITLETQAMAYYMKRFHLYRIANARYAAIGYSTKNLATKSVGDVKRAIRQELVDIDDRITNVLTMLITPGGYNG